MSTAPARPALYLGERRTSPPARRPSRSTPCAARPEAWNPTRLISRAASEGNPYALLCADFKTGELPSSHDRPAGHGGAPSVPGRSTLNGSGRAERDHGLDRADRTTGNASREGRPRATRFRALSNYQAGAGLDRDDVSRRP
jgi:hypothetical protein